MPTDLSLCIFVSILMHSSLIGRFPLNFKFTMAISWYFALQGDFSVDPIY